MLKLCMYACTFLNASTICMNVYRVLKLPKYVYTYCVCVCVCMYVSMNCICVYVV